MKVLLNALEEGRLIELHDNDKSEALSHLALLLEAVPDIGTDQDLIKEVTDREASANTAIGYGIACPHIRSRQNGELLCAVGWSPEGIDYNAPDGKKVHLVIMYYIPDTQRNLYLKEISGLAKAVQESYDLQMYSELKDIQSIRNLLLDWVELITSKAVPNATARMIKLESKISKAEVIANLESPVSAKMNFSVIPFDVFMMGKSHYILSTNPELTDYLDKSTELGNLAANCHLNLGEYQINVLSSQAFTNERTLYQCIGIKAGS